MGQRVVSIKWFNVGLNLYPYTRYVPRWAYQIAVVNLYNTHGNKLRFPPSEKSAICDRVRYSTIAPSKNLSNSSNPPSLHQSGAHLPRQPPRRSAAQLRETAPAFGEPPNARIVRATLRPLPPAAVNIFSARWTSPKCNESTYSVRSMEGVGGDAQNHTNFNASSSVGCAVVPPAWKASRTRTPAAVTSHPSSLAKGS